MKAINTFESPYLALLKSAATEAVAQQSGMKNNSADIDHPFIKGIDHYCDAVMENKPILPPERKHQKQEDDDPEINAYLTLLHHQLVHAHIAGDKTLQAQIEKQRSQFKYGNPLWQQMMLQYFWYYWQYPLHSGQQPHYRSWNTSGKGNNNLNYGVIDWKLPADATIALIGDIGTGTDIAAAVLVAALSFNPDVIVHLGDVYYSGTAFEFAHRYIGLIRDVFKEFGKNIPVFGVPGNHEYFTGAISYYKCLDSLQLAANPTQQQKASYFCLRSADDGWQFLGMDTGYYGHYMDVPPKARKRALELLNLKDNLPIQDTTHPSKMVGVRSDEEKWHQHHLNSFTGRSILCSHHQLYSANQLCGVRQPKGHHSETGVDCEWVNTKLWSQFGPYFEEKVAAWFWGHEHNLGIYQDKYRPTHWNLDAQEGSIFKTLSKGRCIGHASIPVQEKEKPYLEKYPVPLVKPDLKLGVKNGWYNRGFQILKLEGKGNPMQAKYYQVMDADPKPHLLFEEKIV